MKDNKKVLTFYKKDTNEFLGYFKSRGHLLKKKVDDVHIFVSILFNVNSFIDDIYINKPNYKILDSFNNIERTNIKYEYVNYNLILRLNKLKKIKNGIYNN